MSQTNPPRPAKTPVESPAKVAAAQQKVTAAERRAQRAAEAKVAQQKRQRRNLLIGTVAGALLLAVAGYFLYQQYLIQNIGTEIPDEGRAHVNPGEALTFKHYPPSSGTHYTSAQPAGIYRQEVQEGFWVHSLEHGYTVVLVKCPTACPEVYDQLDAIYKKLPESQFNNVKFVVTPYSKPYTDGDARITLVAWNHEQKLDTVDEAVITRFYKKFVDKGPELVP